MCYDKPEEFDGIQGMIPIPHQAIINLENEFYPNPDQLLSTSPEWFKILINDIMNSFEIPQHPLTTSNVWEIFGRTMEAIQAYDMAWLSDPTNDPSQTIYARAQLDM